jgi:hypothetical protein
MKPTGRSIALHDADTIVKNRSHFPNLALMKLSAWHKAQGDTVSWFVPLFSQQYDVIYSSKVFTFTPEESFIDTIQKGGTGYRLFNSLNEPVEHCCPDYSLYNLDYSLGFLTRGCPCTCDHCIVPQKEGKIRASAEIEEFLCHDKVVLMDNNILASSHGIHQIEKLRDLRIKVDFNQGLDCRLIDNTMARLLSQIKWLKPVRLACDSSAQMESLQKAVALLRWHNTTPKKYFVYCLIYDVSEDVIERVRFLKGLYVDVFVQPYRDYGNIVHPSQQQRDFARWVNHPAIFNSVSWEAYQQQKTKRRK